MQRGSLAQLYSSKTDDQLLQLAADSNSLVEEALPILAEELRRRKLVIQPDLAAVDYEPPNFRITAVAKSMRTLAGFLLNLLNAVFGTALLESFVLPNIGFSPPLLNGKYERGCSVSR